MNVVNNIVRVLLVLPLFALSGCNTVLLNASGDVAQQQGHLLVVSTFLMLLIIIPVIGLTFFFAWRYRASNTKATYAPDWDHSTQLELVIWGAPLLIIIALGLLTWISTHTLDPYRPLQRIDAHRTLPAGTKPLIVDVVALDWKWLFIYPEQGFAVVNEVAAPVDVPIEFRITAGSVMNSFFIPTLAGQIYAMPGMQTSLHAVINKTGEFEGLSANYSGAGFSGMHFKFHGMAASDFDRWVALNKRSPAALSRSDYLTLEQPSQHEPVRRFGSVAPDLFGAVINRCVDSHQMCMNEMMAIDMAPHHPESSAALTMPAAASISASTARAGSATAVVSGEAKTQTRSAMSASMPGMPPGAM